MNDEEQPYSATEFPDGPLPNRLTRSTVMGCVGLVGVMALPLMLFLPLETWGLSRWAYLLVQLAAFGALGGGIWLLARVPSAARARSNDPTRPLTASGAAPVLERPAQWPNWVGLGSVCALAVLAAAGIAVAAFDPDQQVAIPIGMAIVSLAGASLAAYGFCLALGRFDPPAFHWVRTPVSESWLPQGGLLMLAGLALLGWALLIATEAHFAWGAIGLVILLLATVLIAPTFRRLPARRRSQRR